MILLISLMKMNALRKKWHWVDCDNNQHEEEGLHLICDGGYHLHSIMETKVDLQWCGATGLNQSLRKDVECVFGMLKKWFMVLKFANRLANIESIGKTFQTCYILPGT